jgi:hypothetical protein
MLRQVRGLGTLVRAEDSANFVARVRLPDFMVRDVQLNQNATVGCHSRAMSSILARHFQTECTPWTLLLMPLCRRKSVEICRLTARLTSKGSKTFPTTGALYTPHQLFDFSFQDCRRRYRGSASQRQVRTGVGANDRSARGTESWRSDHPLGHVQLGHRRPNPSEALICYPHREAERVSAHLLAASTTPLTQRYSERIAGRRDRSSFRLGE